MRERHDGDCTIYALLENHNPTDGICTCGYGWECVRKSGYRSEMYSHERHISTDWQTGRLVDTEKESQCSKH